MVGTNAQTGKALSGIEHCKQSVRDILTTPKGSRVMRRAYGSDLFSLADKPMNLSTRMDLIAATADALSLWEPRIQVTKVDIAVDSNGAVTVDVTGNYLPEGKPIKIDGITVN
jgi:phage baseplate assembly protein W